LLSWIPVPGTKTPEQEPFDVVIDATFPSASATLMCVVPSRDCGPVRRCFSSPVARTIAHARRTTSCGASETGRSAPSRSRARVTMLPPNDGRGFVAMRALR